MRLLQISNEWQMLEGKTSKTVNFFSSRFTSRNTVFQTKKKVLSLFALCSPHIATETTLQSNDFTKCSYDLLWDPFGKTSINLCNEDASGKVMQVCGSPGSWAGVTATGVSSSPEPSDLKAKSPSQRLVSMHFYLLRNSKQHNVTLSCVAPT